MNDEQKKALLWRVIEEGFGRGSVEVIDELVDANVIEHQSNIQPRNREGIKECVRMLHRAFPDLKMMRQHEAVDGNLVWCHFTASGIHTGQLGPFPPTGKRMEITTFDLARIENGRIVEHWGVPDLFSQIEQLGLLPRREVARG